MIIIIKHIAIEGPETFGTFLKSQGFSLKEFELYHNDSLPEELSNIEAVVSLGGPMNVYEEEKYSFLRQDDIFIRKIIDKQIPFLGICLGSQLLAKACDAMVVKSPNEEIGFSKVQFTQEGKCDNLFAGLEGQIDVFQWHGDMFDVPQKGKLLATAEKCPHQVFKVGNNAYGLQFHIEITENSIVEWSDEYLGSNSFKKQQMLDDYKVKKEEFNKVAEIIYSNFVKIIKAHI